MKAIETGDPAAVLGRSKDATRREEFYRSILESLGEGVIITDRESRILYANSRVECLTGRPAAERAAGRQRGKLRLRGSAARWAAALGFGASGAVSKFAG